MAFRVIAAGQDKDDNTVNFVAMTNRMSSTEAGEYLKWINNNGPQIKRLIEKELFKDDSVQNVVFTIDGD